MTRSVSKPKGIFMAVAISFVLVMTSTASFVQSEPRLPQAAYLTQELALDAAKAALDQCRTDGYRVAVAVVDCSGTLLALLRDPEAGPHTVGSSQGKSFASASMGRSTADLARTISENPDEVCAEVGLKKIGSG